MKYKIDLSFLLLECLMNYDKGLLIHHTALKNQTTVKIHLCYVVDLVWLLEPI